jgi:hypothetical protein
VIDQRAALRAYLRHGMIVKQSEFDRRRQRVVRGGDLAMAIVGAGLLIAVLASLLAP